MKGEESLNAQLSENEEAFTLNIKINEVGQSLKKDDGCNRLHVITNVQVYRPKYYVVLILGNDMALIMFLYLYVIRNIYLPYMSLIIRF